MRNRSQLTAVLTGSWDARNLCRTGWAARAGSLPSATAPAHSRRPQDADSRFGDFGDARAVVALRELLRTDRSCGRPACPAARRRRDARKTARRTSRRAAGRGCAAAARRARAEAAHVAAAATQSRSLTQAPPCRRRTTTSPAGKSRLREARVVRRRRGKCGAAWPGGAGAHLTKGTPSTVRYDHGTGDRIRPTHQLRTPTVFVSGAVPPPAGAVGGRCAATQNGWRGSPPGGHPAGELITLLFG